MKSTAFRNLVLAFYVCVGFLLFIITQVMLKDEFQNSALPFKNLVLEQTNLIAFVITLPFFGGFLYSYLYNKIFFTSIVYFAIISSLSIFFELDKNTSVIDIIPTCLFLFVILVFLISFGQHPKFSQSNSILKNSDTILDKFEDNYQSRENIPYFLRIHRVFAFVFIVIGTVIIIMSTQTGRHLSVNTGLLLTFLGFVFLVFAGLLWKFPKVMSWIIALFYLGIFLFTEFMLISETIQSIDLLKTFLMLVFCSIFLFLALIVISKTAREEWKMK